MALIVPNVGEIKMLERALNSVSVDDPVYHLYENSIAPAETVTITPTTGLEEMTSAGYSAITCVGTDWTIATTAGVTIGEHAEITFTTTTSATAYGYYVTDSSGNLLWFGEFSDGPYVLPGGGGSITVVPKIGAD